MVLIKVKKLEGIELPEYMTPGASGFDIKAYLEEPRIIYPKEVELIPTKLFFELPEEYEIQVRPRSGLAAKHHLFILNSPGTLDDDYRGEIIVILGNFGKEIYTVHHGERIAQGVLAKVEKAEFTLVDKLISTSRNEGGFGHTGK